MANLQNFRDRIIYRLGNRDDLASGLGATALDSWINEAYREIAHSVTFHELQGLITLTTVVSTRTVSLVNQNVFAVTSVRDTTNNRLLEPFVGTFAEYQRVIGTATQAPAEWIHYGTDLYLRPIPNAAVSLQVGIINDVTELTAASNIPVIPATWHLGIELLGARNGWRALGEDGKALGIERNEYGSFMSRVGTSKRIESRLARRRGIRVRHMIVNRNAGV
jgi:hypothetical protein